ncbi:MAG: hypothetical protein B7W98_02060, partial [Parcubacteria group bacterium 20-58-5]
MKITLTPLERERYDIVRSCIDRDITNAEAAARLGLQVRQVQNLKRAVEKDGEQGILHGSRGRASNRATHPETVSIVTVFLKDEKHRDFGPTFAQEQLVKQGVILCTETIRSLMIKEKLWKPKARRGPAIHREWRPRMQMKGELVQFDGSYHDWFEDGTEACLLAAADDATSEVSAVFEDNEGVRSVFRFWWQYILTNGLPVAIYLDKFSTYKVNHKNAVDNAEMLTQFERAMAELGIRVICANSPEAKGRIERLFGTLQDRLVKEMRLRSIKTRDDANRYLAEEYLDDHNGRFSVAPKKEGDAHRPLTEDLRKRLSSIFSIQSERRVNNDFTIQFKSRWFQLAATQNTTVYKGDTVTIEERLDDSLCIRLRDTYLAYAELPDRPKRIKMKVVALTKEKPRWVPPADHPWRKAA